MNSIKDLMGIDSEKKKKKDLTQQNQLKIGVYRRVSTREQAEEGKSLSAQKSKIFNYLEIDNFFQNKELSIIDYVDEGLSAKNLNRKGLLDLLKDIKNKKLNYIIVVKLDRLTRNLKDLQYLSESFAKCDVKLISINEKLDTESASGRFFISILGSLAQLEREQVSERVKSVFDVLIYQKALGGATPYGYVYIKSKNKDKGRYIPHNLENCSENHIPTIYAPSVHEPIFLAPIVQNIFDWFFAYKSFSIIGRRLMDLSIPTPKVIQDQFKLFYNSEDNENSLKLYIENPGIWYVSTIKGILLNPFYTGTRLWNRYNNRLKKDRNKKDWIFIENAHPSIVTLKQFAFVRQILIDKNRVIKR